MQGRAVNEQELREMRVKLTQIAVRIVASEGREACSLRRVANEAGMSRSTPYTYFESKEALLDAVRVAALNALADDCEAALRASELIPDRLRGVGRAYVNFALTHTALYDLIYERHLPSREHDEAAARYRQCAESPLREAFELGLVTMPPERLGHVLWASTHGLIGLHRAGKLRHGVPFETVLQDIGDTLAFGFVPRGKS